ncbi:MAG: mechanosensitive ion channel [Phycisphaera sp.]|nr:mechanosensitive ion channel [Phycisphaera sp.]
MPSEWIDHAVNATGLSADAVWRLIWSVVVLLLAFITRFVILRVLRKRVTDIKRHYYWRRTTNYIFGIVTLLAIGRVWFSGLQDLGTFLGLVSAGIAIALSDLISNLAGFLFIVTRRPYEVGDRIEMSGHRGDVIDVRLFQTYLLELGAWVDADQSTGRTIAMPNNMIFRNPVANYTRGFEHIWDELGVLVTFESDWKKAKEILVRIANEHASPLSQGAQEQIRRAASKQMIFFNVLTPTVYTDVKDSGVMLTLRYLVLPRQRRGNKEKIWEAILKAFAEEPTIDFAYPTTRMYLNHYEGKEGAKAPTPPGS